MAKNQSRPDQQGKIKVRVIELEMEGSDDSLQEGLKSLAAALSRGGSAIVTRVKTEANRQIANSTAPAPHDELDEVEDIDAELEEEVVPAPKSRAPRRAPKVVVATILNDVRLDDVEPTFKDFAAAKSPTSDMSKYLVVAYWFKTYKGITNLTGNHFYTAYKMAGWKVPRDCAQPARELKNPRVGKFSAGSEAGTFMINQIGENSIGDMAG